MIKFTIQKLKNTTTRLGGLRQGIPFTWGEVVEIHDFGSDSIIEYNSVGIKLIKFMSYKNGIKIDRAFLSIEEAKEALNG